MQESVVIVAGGSGTRMQSEIPKQFLPLHNEPVLFYTMRAFHAYNKQIKIVLVLPESQIHYWRSICNKHSFNIQHLVTEGGKTRFHSVKNGLKLIGHNETVGIHDGVRPLVSINTIKQAYKTARKMGSALPVIDVVDTVRFVDKQSNHSVNRNHYKLVQTPQVFQSTLLSKAYNLPYDKNFTDDASVFEAAGNNITLVNGNRENIKITTTIDLAIAEAFLDKFIMPG